jgi:hypothetical protein
MGVRVLWFRVYPQRVTTFSKIVQALSQLAATRIGCAAFSSRFPNFGLDKAGL